MPPGCVDRRQMTRSPGIEPYRNKGRKATSEIVTAVDSVAASKSSGYGLAEEEDDDDIILDQGIFKEGVANKVGRLLNDRCGGVARLGHKADWPDHRTRVRRQPQGSNNLLQRRCPRESNEEAAEKRVSCSCDFPYSHQSGILQPLPSSTPRTDPPPANFFLSLAQSSTTPSSTPNGTPLSLLPSRVNQPTDFQGYRPSLDRSLSQARISHYCPYYSASDRSITATPPCDWQSCRLDIFHTVRPHKSIICTKPSVPALASCSSHLRPIAQASINLSRLDRAACHYRPSSPLTPDSVGATRSALSTHTLRWESGRGQYELQAPAGDQGLPRSYKPSTAPTTLVRHTRTLGRAGCPQTSGL